MAEGDIGAVIDTLEFEAGVATNPKLIHVIGDMFAIAYTGPDGDGWIATVEIDSAGAIPAAIEDSLEFEAEAANDVDFIKITNGVFAVAYRDASNHGWMKSVTINAAGEIALVTGGSLEFETGACYTPNIVHVSGDVFAIAYRDSSVHGHLITVTIESDGAPIAVTGYSTDFDGTRALRPHIIHAIGDFFAIAYQGVDDDGFVVTVDIASDGTIEAGTTDSLEFDIADIARARILQISASVYVIAYQNSDYDGDLVTVSISAAGAIGDSTLDDQEFEAFAASEASIIHVSGNFFAIAYRGVADDGWLKTWEISEAGVIAALKQDELEFDGTYGAYPTILHVSGDIYAIAYTSGAAGGKVISLDIGTVAVSAATQHLMLMGVG